MLSEEVMAAAIAEFDRAWNLANSTTALPPGSGARRRAGLTAVFRMPEVQQEIVRQFRDELEADQDEMRSQMAEEVNDPRYWHDF